MNYIHSIEIPETPEDEFIVRTRNITYLLSKETFNWKDIHRQQSELIDAFNDLSPELQKKYQRQYDDLLKQSRSRMPLVDPIDIFQP